MALGLGLNRLGRGVLGKASSGVLSSYLGQVATRTYLPDASNTTNKQLRARSAHVAMDAIVNPTLIFPNFFVDGFGAGATYAELGAGAASTITASIEYPSGTFTQVTFSGSSSGSIPNIGTLAGTATVSIAKGDWFWVRVFIANTGGVVFSLGGVGGGAGNVPGNFNLGDVLDAAASGLTDNTMGGAYTATSGTSRYSPIIIASQTTLPSVLVVGDSKSYGENDAGDGRGDVGEVQRWISPYFANANWGIRGRDAGQFVANSTIQTSFNSYFTHLVNEDGINCFIHGQSAATAATNTDALAALFPTLKKYVTTILPSATTTDNYATTVNQTTASYNAGRVTENNRRRGIPAPWVGVFESADAVESSRDSGLITPAVGYFVTASSVHPARAGYLAVRDANRTAAKLLSRNGSPLTFANQVFIDQTDFASDETDLGTYTWSGRNFLIGAASANRLVIAGVTSRFGTTGATATSCTIGGVAATKVDEVINITGGAETIQTIWVAAVPTGTTATVSAVFSTTMIRASCDLWTATGDSALPTIGQHANAQGAAATATTSAITVPARGGAIAFSSTVNGSLPTVTLTNHVPVTAPVQVGTGTLYVASGSIQQAGSKTFGATYSAGASTTIVAVAVSP
jgi:hypothetical protein